ncbi:hypothetical protein HQ529_00340 [Candidatus Woesearchaeota archaeon]|nr:hypothetical protein [Candidatus Woesearchaeota archaeon]
MKEYEPKLIKGIEDFLGIPWIGNKDPASFKDKKHIIWIHPGYVWAHDGEANNQPISFDNEVRYQLKNFDKYIGNVDERFFDYDLCKSAERFISEDIYGKEFFDIQKQVAFIKSSANQPRISNLKKAVVLWDVAREIRLMETLSSNKDATITVGVGVNEKGFKYNSDRPTEQEMVDNMIKSMNEPFEYKILETVAIKFSQAIINNANKQNIQFFLSYSPDNNLISPRSGFIKRKKADYEGISEQQWETFKQLVEHNSQSYLIGSYVNECMRDSVAELLPIMQELKVMYELSNIARKSHSHPREAPSHAFVKDWFYFDPVVLEVMDSLRDAKTTDQRIDVLLSNPRFNEYIKSPDLKRHFSSNEMDCPIVGDNIEKLYILDKQQAMQELGFNI